MTEKSATPDGRMTVTPDGGGSGGVIIQTVEAVKFYGTDATGTLIAFDWPEEFPDDTYIAHFTCTADDSHNFKPEVWSVYSRTVAVVTFRVFATSNQNRASAVTGIWTP